MTINRLVAAAAMIAMSGAAVAQDRNLDGGVNAHGTIGPTVTARPPANSARSAQDPDAGHYGVPGGVGDPSVGAGLTRGFMTTPSSLNQRYAGPRSRGIRR